MYLKFTIHKFALIATHTFDLHNCTLLCFVFKFKDIVDVVNGIYQEFSLPIFYKVHSTSQNCSSFSVICCFFLSRNL